MIKCRDCIYGWGRCDNIYGAYFGVPVYPHDTCPYAVVEVEGADDMRITAENTLFIPDVSRIGYQLRNVRENKGMTITEVAENSKVSISFMCQVEHGKKVAKLESLVSWVNALGYQNIVIIGEKV